MKPIRATAFVSIGLAAGLVFARYASFDVDKYAKHRSLDLLTLYPPGTTSRFDVATRWSPLHPEFSEVRPKDGWSHFPTPYVRDRVLDSERRTGKSVHRCERYWGPDGISGGLCYCWFYYDDADMITDVEWQFHTD